jgi:hypothetical protein
MSDDDSLDSSSPAKSKKASQKRKHSSMAGKSADEEPKPNIPNLMLEMLQKRHEVVEQNVETQKIEAQANALRAEAQAQESKACTANEVMEKQKKKVELAEQLLSKARASGDAEGIAKWQNYYDVLLDEFFAM